MLTKMLRPAWDLFTRPVWGGKGAHVWVLCGGYAIASVLALAGYVAFEANELSIARTLVGLMPYTFPVIIISLPFVGWRKRKKLTRPYIVWAAVPVGVWLGLLVTIHGVVLV